MTFQIVVIKYYVNAVDMYDKRHNLRTEECESDFSSPIFLYTMVFLLYAIFSIIGSDSNIFCVFKYFNIDLKRQILHIDLIFSSTHPKKSQFCLQLYIHFA